MSRRLLLAAVLSLVALSGCSRADSGSGAASAKTDEQEDKSVSSMTVDEVDAALTAKQIVAVDCNAANVRKKEGVLPGAILVSDEDSYAASELPADKTTKLVFYCAGHG